MLGFSNLGTFRLEPSMSVKEDGFISSCKYFININKSKTILWSNKWSISGLINYKWSNKQLKQFID